MNRSRQQFKICYKLLLITAIILFGNAPEVVFAEAPVLKKGRVNLTDWDFQSKTINLDGEWEFYWHRLLEPADFQNNPIEPEYVRVPSTWKETRINGEIRGPYGFGTYRVIMNVPPGNYAIYHSKIETAYRTFVNGSEVARVGRVGETYNTAQPKYWSSLCYFTSNQDTIEIIIQVSNFRHFQSGILRPVKFGNASKISNFSLRKQAINFLIAGCFFITALYNLTIFAHRRNNKAPLFFALFCLSACAYMVFLIEKLHIQLFPDFNWEINIKILYFTFLYTGITYLLCLRELFPLDADNTIVRTLWVATTLIALVVLATKAVVHLRLAEFSYLLLLLTIVYCLVILIRALIKKRAGALGHAIPCFIVFITTLNDALHSTGVINTFRMMPVGVLFFVILQFAYMGRSLALSLNRTEALSSELESENVRLAGLLEGCEIEIGKILSNLDKLLYIQSNGHFCLIHLDGKNKTPPIELDMPIGKVPTAINGHKFIDVHRSYLVALNKIQGIKRVAGNNYEVVFRGTGTRIPASRHKMPKLKQEHPNLFK